MRWLLVGAAGLVFLAGIQLFLLTEQTSTYFAWTVSPPFTAAFLGAAYWGATAVELLSARGRSWAGARAAIPGIWVFTTLTLVATLAHFDKFHFGATNPVPRAAAWLWLGIYATVPVAIVLAWISQRRYAGGDPEPVTPVPTGLRWAFAVLGAGMFVVGALLFSAPAVIDPAWPWVLTPLTSQVVGAWLLGTGLTSLVAFRETELGNVFPIGAGFATFSILALVGLARFGAEVDSDSVGLWVYVGFVLALLVSGLFTTLVARRSGTGRRLQGVS